MSNRPPPPPNTPSSKGEPRAEAAGRRRPPSWWMAEALGVLVIAAVVDTALRAVVAPFDRVDMIYHFEGGRSSPAFRTPRYLCERTRRTAANLAFRVVATVPDGVDGLDAAGLVPGDRHVAVSVDCNEVTE